MLNQFDNKTSVSGKPEDPSVLEDLVVTLLWGGFDDLPPGAWYHPSLSNYHWRLYQNDGPGGHLFLPNSVLDIEQQEVYLIPSGMELRSDNDQHFNQLYIHFDLSGVPPIVLQEIFPGPVKVPHSKVLCDMANELGNSMRSWGYSDFGNQCQMKGLAYSALGCYFRALSSDLLERCRLRLSALRPVLPALQYIQERLNQQITNDEMAKLCTMSEDYFIRRFREAIGLSPTQYVLRRRIGLSAQRLLFTNDTIDQIAEQTGFGDRFYFSRVFARQVGQPPAAYRRGPRL